MPESTRGAHRWRLSLGGRGPVVVESIVFEPSSDGIYLDPVDFVGTRAPGEILVLGWYDTLNSPSRYMLVLRWRWPDSDETITQRQTLL